MELKVKVNIIDETDKSITGPGIIQLLDLLKEEKSLNKASKRMNISYVKAKRLLDQMEEKLGKKILIRRRGGVDRGGTELSEFGLKYLEEFKKMKEKITDFSNKQFASFLKVIDI
jgi:molybdate transport system regulatory protein